MGRLLDDSRRHIAVKVEGEPGIRRRAALDRLASIAREAMDTDACVLSLRGTDSWLAAAANAARGRPWPSADPVAGVVVEKGTVVTASPEDDGDCVRALPAGFRSYMGAPIVHASRRSVFGVLAVLDERPRGWSSRERDLLAKLADAAAAEIVAVDLAAELEAANAHLDRVRSELEQERVQLREMIRMAPAFIASVEGPDAVFTMANDPFYQLVGRRNLIGRPLREALPELAEQRVMQLIDKVYREGQSLGADEAKIRLRKGEDGPLEERFVSFVYQPLIGPEWEVAGVLVCGVDLTEQVLARKAAEAAAADFRMMAETIHQVFWMADASGAKLMYVSPSFREVWGVERDEVLAANGWFETIALEDRDRFSALRTPARLQAGEYDLEYRIVRPDGAVRWIRDQAYPIAGEDGVIHRIVGIVEDTTERRTLEMQLRQSQKMEAVGRLAGGIAHDFNNMLTAITGHAQLLEAELPGSSPLREHLEVIRMAADRSAGLTRQLLAFSRKQILQPQVIDLNDVVRSMEPMLRRMIGEDIDIRTGLASGLSAIYADPGQVEQVLMNLVVNARDAMPGGGRLTLTTREIDLTEAYFNAHQVDMRPGRYAMLAVSDTGIGMDPVTQARIFEPFFTTKPPGKGTGLGLSTVYGIVKQTGGFVWVYAEAGIGSTFKVYLPLAPGQATERPVQAPPPQVPPEGATVLVVEDDASVRGLVVRVLRRAGYHVVEADGGAATAAALATRTGRLDLLLTDVVLPSMSGREVADYVLRRHPEARLLFMSGYTDEAIVHHGVLDPGTEFLEKPFTPELLLRKVSEVLQAGIES